MKELYPFEHVTFKKIKILILKELKHHERENNLS